MPEHPTGHGEPEKTNPLVRSTGQVPPEAWGLFLGSTLTRLCLLIKFDHKWDETEP